MKAIAFETKIQEGMIQIPIHYQQQLKENETVKIVILTDDSSNEEIDPITPLVGSLKAKVHNIGENHDLYLGANLAQSEE